MVSAMMFVAVSGEDLTFELRRSSGAVMKTGPEPFMLRTGLSMLDNGDCYYVVVSNNSGTATSEQGCLTVEEIDWVLDPSDDPENEDDTNYALGFGECAHAYRADRHRSIHGIRGRYYARGFSDGIRTAAKLLSRVVRRHDHRRRHGDARFGPAAAGAPHAERILG